MTVNTAYSLSYNQTVGLIEKLVRQFIEGANIKNRFSALDKDAVLYGNGFEIDLVLSAKKQTDLSTKAEEHKAYTPKVMAMTFNTKVGGQYAVTLDERRVAECVGNEDAARRYAAELTQSLYGGWFNDKNAAVAKAAADIAAKASTNKVEIQLGTDVADYAAQVLMNVKAKVEDLREGVSGTSFGNTFVAGDIVASDDIFIIMSNTMAATLDVYGYARVFGPDYVRTANVTRITSNRIPEDTVLITSSKNIQVRPKFERFVSIQNSDGSMNFFYNKEEYIEAAIESSGEYVGFPYFVIKKAEV